MLILPSFCFSIFFPFFVEDAILFIAFVFTFLSTTLIFFSAFSSDVVSIPKTSENFRLLYDTKGRFRLHSVRDEEAKVSYCPFDVEI